MENNPRYRSFFWPILLVGVGVIWLLGNLGIIQTISFGSVLRLWPLLLIILGIDILFSRRYPWVGAVVSLLAVAGVVALLIAGPKLGFDTGPVNKTETLSSPVEGVESVEYDFNTSSAPVDIHVLEGNTTDLISAEITHTGNMNFDVSGTSSKTVQLSQESDGSNWFFLDFSFESYKWNIGLAPDVLSDIILNGGSGSIELDLSGIELSSLRTNLASGSSDITLPETDVPYTADIETGSGSVQLDLPDNTSLTLTLDTSSGSTSVSLPSGAAYRIEVEDKGSGSQSFDNDVLQKSSDSENFDVGAMQTADYDQADHPILIKIIGHGSGSISIH